ncbi:type VI immunity family protein [Myxococcus hansupus]|nr:type VI immunity family protein [Myxococcus hansupus]
MSIPPPKLQLQDRDNATGVSVGLSATFYLPYAHAPLAPVVLQSLERYQRAVGPQVLTSYAGEDGEWQHLDSRGWAAVRREMQDAPWANVLLSDASPEAPFRFEYVRRDRVDGPLESGVGEVSVVTFWLSTGFLEQHGPREARELMVALAEPLPFSSGNAGLAFSAALDVSANVRQVRRACLRYPGLDVLRPGITSLNIGTRVRGPSWLTFLGTPVLGQLGGVDALRARLTTPGITVQALEQASAVVTLGEWPEMGDGEPLPAYRELARVLEPWMLWGEGESILGLTPEEARRWERRFLD